MVKKILLIGFILGVVVCLVFMYCAIIVSKRGDDK